MPFILIKAVIDQSGNNPELKILVGDAKKLISELQKYIT